MNVIEITYTKIQYIIRKIPKLKRKQNGRKWWKIHAKSGEGSGVYLCFVSRIARFN